MSKGTKKPYGDVYPVAQEIVEKLSPYCDRIEIAGSLRRKRKMIGDIEIVALPKYATQKNLFEEVVATENLLHYFLIYETKTALTKGVGENARQKQFMYAGIQVDLFLPASPDHWGSIFFIRTGSHTFNMWVMNERCKHVDIKFFQGRLYKHISLNNAQKTPNEEDVFEALQMDFVPPECRDDGGWLDYVK